MLASPLQKPMFIGRDLRGKVEKHILLHILPQKLEASAE